MAKNTTANVEAPTIEKLDPRVDGSSLDILGQNIETMRSLFPEVFTEGTDDDGPRWKIDLEALGELLGEFVEDKPERYSFNWHGKSRARRIAQTPSTGTLRPCHEESVNWDTTKNIFVEGDNLEVLKLLQKSYHKRVKMIYIDPPYNTGKEFIYPDKFQDNLDTYLRYTGQVGEDGLKISANAETGGRYHTNWLNMMLPRIRLAKNLLTDDGVCFISISDIEHSNLKKLCDEIFGEECFVAALVWNTEGNTDNQLAVKVNHEFVLMYVKKREMLNEAVGFVVDPNTPKDSNLLKGYADNNITKNGVGNPPQTITLPAGFPSAEPNMTLEAEQVDKQFFTITATEKLISNEVKEKYSISQLPVRLDQMNVRNGKLLKPCRVYGGYANV